MTKFGVPEEFLKVCGCIPLDFYREEFRSKLIPKEELFARFGDDRQLSDVEWEEFLKNYDHITYKNMFNAKEKAEQDAEHHP
jgi:hypothetical protein